MLRRNTSRGSIPETDDLYLTDDHPLPPHKERLSLPSNKIQSDLELDPSIQLQPKTPPSQRQTVLGEELASLTVEDLNAFSVTKNVKEALSRPSNGKDNIQRLNSGSMIAMGDEASISANEKTAEIVTATMDIILTEIRELDSKQNRMEIRMSLQMKRLEDMLTQIWSKSQAEMSQPFVRRGSVGTVSDITMGSNFSRPPDPHQHQDPGHQLGIQQSGDNYVGHFNSPPTALPQPQPGHLTSGSDGGSMYSGNIYSGYTNRSPGKITPRLSPQAPRITSPPLPSHISENILWESTTPFASPQNPPSVRTANFMGAAPKNFPDALGQFPSNAGTAASSSVSQNGVQGDRTTSPILPDRPVNAKKSQVLSPRY